MKFKTHLHNQNLLRSETLRIHICDDSTKLRTLSFIQSEYCHYYRNLRTRKSNSRTYLEFKTSLNDGKQKLKLDLDRMGANSPEFLSSHTQCVFFFSASFPFSYRALYACKVLVRNSRLDSFLTRVY